MFPECNSYFAIRTPYCFRISAKEECGTFYNAAVQNQWRCCYCYPTPFHSLSRLKQQALWLEISGEHPLMRERRVPTPLANCLSRERRTLCLPATPKPSSRWQGKPMDCSCAGSLHSNLRHLETELGRPTCLWMVTPGGPEGKGNACRRALTPLRGVRLGSP